jgi:hypothetical protein
MQTKIVASLISCLAMLHPFELHFGVYPKSSSSLKSQKEEMDVPAGVRETSKHFQGRCSPLAGAGFGHQPPTTNSEVPQYLP